MPEEKPPAAEKYCMTAEEVDNFSWAIRPCFLYQEEFSDCTSIKARFHQYFIHGDSQDCSQWKTDYKNCLKWEEKKDLQAATDVIKSEEQRRLARLRDHYGNTVWTKRQEPPASWNAPLPEWLQERQKNTYLELKAREMKGEKVADPDAGKGFCAIM